MTIEIKAVASIIDCESNWGINNDNGIFLKFAKRNRLNLKQIIQVSKLIEYHDISINSLTEEDLNALLEPFTREELIMLFQLTYIFII